MRIIIFTLLLLLPNMADAKGFIIEAESFNNKGGWKVDQQFMDQMGSPYLLAHGIGIPVEDASTEIEIPSVGKYYIYVRTYNWISPWCRKNGPGKFKIKVNGKSIGHVVGNKGNKWMWQKVGSVKISEKKINLSLHDLTGFEGRCDAIYFTKDAKDVPLSSTAGTKALRNKVAIVNGGQFDIVVVGGGIGGLCTAVSAARQGCKVALINDRPILGGNNSSEVHVNLGGRLNQDPYPQLGNLIYEFGMPRSIFNDNSKKALVDAEKNISLFLNYRADSLTKSGSTIKSVIAKNILDGKCIELHAHLFSDCTGDACIGYMAGAEFLYGRESYEKYHESTAPQTADKQVLGTTVQWYSANAKRPIKFPLFEYGIKYTDKTCEPLLKGDWRWETGMLKDQINEAEQIRDYALLVAYSNWSYLKNDYKEKNKFANYEIAWMGYISGKRESRRLIGDHVLTENDLINRTPYPDASFITTWGLDLHYPDSINMQNFPGHEYKAISICPAIHPYAVPYRCLYSKNISNLFMSGRDISVSHVALGTTRVMRTIGMMGEVVGMAASICKKHLCTPREVYEKFLPELKALMTKGVSNVVRPDTQCYNWGNTLGK